MRDAERTVIVVTSLVLPSLRLRVQFGTRCARAPTRHCGTRAAEGGFLRLSVTHHRELARPADETRRGTAIKVPTGPPALVPLGAGMSCQSI